MNDNMHVFVTAALMVQLLGKKQNFLLNIMKEKFKKHFIEVAFSSFLEEVFGFQPKSVKKKLCKKNSKVSKTGQFEQN